MASDDLRKIAADLREARRYTRRDIDEAIGQTGDCVAAINAILMPRSAPIGEKAYHVLERLATNLCVGQRHALSMPDLLAAYLVAAADELDILAGPVEVPEVAEVVA